MAPAALMDEADNVTLLPNATFSPKVCAPVVVMADPLICNKPPVLVVTVLAVTAPPKVVVPVLYVIFVEDLGWIRWGQPAPRRGSSG